MSLVIRFTRIGRKGEAKYRLVVKEKRSKRDGAAIDTIGFYEKMTGGRSIKNIDEEKLKLWRSRGALLSPSAELALGLSTK
ncbi:MAG TPA: 30S ribosomal protein S16 [Patescibacteria group bacterium]|nr:30S ribosomal protein S16 [Patescibacteria group bacterium]